MDTETYYKELHRIPELSEEEYKTSDYIFKTLQTLGYSPIKTADTGVYADKVQDPALPWLLFRADIDALAIREEPVLPYSSVHEGHMHACGHDAHSAMLLKTASILKNLSTPQNIRFLFQPAEETTRGAAKVLECGILPSPLSACFAIHVWPGIPKGEISTSASTMMASSDVFRIMITGKSAHCAQRASGNDAMHTAVDIASAIYDAGKEWEKDDTILFCGSIHSGASHNIVSNRGELYGTIRTFSVKNRKKCKDLLETICMSVTQRYGTSYEIVWEGGAPPLQNNMDILKSLQKIHPGLRMDAPSTYAAEDFAAYLQHAPGAMLWLGTGDTPPLHTKDFFVPLDILHAGVSLWTKIAAHKW